MAFETVGHWEAVWWAAGIIAMVKKAWNTSYRSGWGTQFCTALWPLPCMFSIPSDRNGSHQQATLPASAFTSAPAGSVGMANLTLQAQGSDPPSRFKTSLPACAVWLSPSAVTPRGPRVLMVQVRLWGLNSRGWVPCGACCTVSTEWHLAEWQGHPSSVCEAKVPGAAFRHFFANPRK